VANTAVCRTVIQGFESPSRLTVAKIMNERKQRSEKRKLNKRVKWGAIIVGVGLLAESAPVAIVGGGLALSGIIFESKGKKKEMQPQAA
jgi:hypothetical protein